MHLLNTTDKVENTNTKLRFKIKAALFVDCEFFSLILRSSNSLPQHFDCEKRYFFMQL